MSIRFNEKKIKRALIDKDMTQTEIAEASGIAYTTINQIFNGRRCCDETAKDIANALGMPLGELIESRKAKKIEPKETGWSSYEDLGSVFVNVRDLLIKAERAGFVKTVDLLLNGGIKLWEEV